MACPKPILYANQEWKTAWLSRTPPPDTSRWGDPLQRSIAPHVASNPLDRCTQPAIPIPQATPQHPTPGHPPSSLYNGPNARQQPQPSQQTAPRQATPTPPQTSKQSRACVHDIVWSSNHLPRPKKPPKLVYNLRFFFYTAIVEIAVCS